MTCNLAKVPSHAVVTKKGNENRANYVRVLLEASKLYGNDSGNFTLFDSAKYGKKDLLFKDSTVELVDVSNNTYEEFLGEDYMNVIKGLSDCGEGNGGDENGGDGNGGGGNGGKGNGGKDSIKPYFLASVALAFVALVLSGSAA